MPPEIAQPYVQTNEPPAAPQAGTAPRVLTRSNMLQQIEENEALQTLIQRSRHGQAKREFAPVTLGLISAAIAATLAFTSQKSQEILGVIRNLRGDGRMQKERGAGASGNTDLHNLVDEYEKHLASYPHLSVDPADKPQNISMWLHNEYEQMKGLTITSNNERVSRKLKNYEIVTSDSKAAVAKVIETWQEKAANKVLSAVEEKDRFKAIEKAYENAYTSITSARQEYRTAVDSEVLRHINHLGKKFGFENLTKDAKLRTVGFAATVAMAAGSAVYFLVKFITREGKEERDDRLALQATKEWELSQVHKEKKHVNAADELAHELSQSEARVRQFAQAMPQSFVDRTKAPVELDTQRVR